MKLKEKKYTIGQMLKGKVPGVVATQTQESTTGVGLMVRTSNSYHAYSVIMKPDTHGLYVMRKLTIEGSRVVKVEDDVEDLKHIKMAKVEDEFTFQS